MMNYWNLEMSSDKDVTSSKSLKRAVCACVVRHLYYNIHRGEAGEKKEGGVWRDSLPQSPNMVSPFL